MKLLKHIPNTLTSLNILCGTLSVFYAMNGLIYMAAIFIFIGAVFDFSDGFAARALKAYSPMGKELDSLADMVSFGLAPMAILHMMLKQELTGSVSTNFFELSYNYKLILLSPFIVTVFSGLRLAKFNVDTRQSESFIGLTTTATGLFIASVAFVFNNEANYISSIFHNYLLLLAFVPIFSFLLVSEIPMFSLKFKNFSFSSNIDKYLLILTAVMCIVFFGMGGIAVTIAIYVLFSVFRALVLTLK